MTTPRPGISNISKTSVEFCSPKELLSKDKEPVSVDQTAISSNVGFDKINFVLADSSIQQHVYRLEDKASEFVQRHHNRFFPLDKGDKNGNIAVGTMVENGHGKDIFMVSHAGLQGTVHPTHYMMLHDENILTAVDFQRICNNVCYAYGRATVSVSIAPPVYHANLAAIALALMSAY
ncbi:Piwi domain-domain-containing protein [Tuber borchii]|uniref:Piwi domain-domain-containing protein n=1 Tax=Tuber borchii TaxID=42251 RepID=A0A2T6ZTI0_TUBBO|nr:Piwi domain-domain-containing protein [Tuber borchii]